MFFLAARASSDRQLVCRSGHAGATPRSSSGSCFHRRLAIEGYLARDSGGTMATRRDPWDALPLFGIVAGLVK